MANAKDFRKDITEKLVGMLERGEAPLWRKPWDASSMQVPQNAVSGKPYRGANAYLLMMVGGSDHRWVTSAQLHHLAEEQLRKAGFDPVYDKNVKDDKGNITHRGRGWLDAKTDTEIGAEHIPRLKKGAKYQPIEFWKFDSEQKVEGPDGKEQTVKVERHRPVAQLYYVYNLGDVENLNLERFQEKGKGHEHAAIEAAEKVLAASGVPIIHHQSDRAYYAPGEDKVHMPPPEAFPTREAYYGVALHELGHATSHPDRLNRDLSNYSLDIQARAKEELRAELCSVFMAAEIGIMPDLTNHGAYLGSWAKTLQKDSNELFRAAADAQKMADFLMGRHLEQERGPEAGKEGVVISKPQPQPDGSVAVMVLRRDESGKAVDSVAVAGKTDTEARDQAFKVVQRAVAEPQVPLAKVKEQVLAGEGREQSTPKVGR